MGQVVLVIGVDDVERRRLRRGLEVAGFGMLEATSAVEGLLHVLDFQPSLILLSEEVPPLVAGDLLTVVGRLTGAPVIVIGSGGDPDEVAALENGAAFYLRRPFSLQLLVARCRSRLRRCEPSARAPPIPANLKGLTRTERRLLGCLAAHRGRPVPTQELVLQVWGGQATSSAVKFHAWRLRRKLEQSGCGLRLQALPTVGYRVIEEEPRPAVATRD